MRQYELREQKEISKMICNQCGKEIPVSGGHATKGLLRVVSALRVIAPELPFPIIYKEIEVAEQTF